MITVKKFLAVGFLLGLAVTAAQADPPQVTGVRMVPRPGSYTVDIYYKLTNGNAYITLSIETNSLIAPDWSGVKIPDRNVTRLHGDVSRLIAADDANEKHIVWNAGEDWPGQSVAEARAKVAAWSPDNPPRYLVLDLGGAYYTNAIQTLAYISEEALPFGGLSNDVYRSNLLVLRRVDKGTFWMGSPGTEAWHQSNEDWHPVTLTNDFYIGVFEVTQGQWLRVMNATPAFNQNSSGQYDKPLRPVENITYDTIRGGTWPQAGDTVGANTFVGALRQKTGLRFDLPTEAQWEYACRAGTQTSLNNGRELTTTTALCTNRLPIAWDAYNSVAIVGVYDVNTYRHHRVGEKQPNAWGLYDMLGNVCETVRDWYTANLGTSSVTEPTGPASRAMGTGNNDARVRKSGGYTGMRDPRSGYRDVSALSAVTGFRLALVPWDPAP